jgi:hypothetical protein
LEKKYFSKYPGKGGKSRKTPQLAATSWRHLASPAPFFYANGVVPQRPGLDEGLPWTWIPEFPQP